MRFLQIFKKLSICLFLLVLFNEFLIYYIVLLSCKWPDDIHPVNGIQPVRAMLFADTHLLGPIKGHWWDKLRREWQMHRAYQTAITIFRPEVVFLLGDVFDEGNWVNQKEFDSYVLRFHKLFHTPHDIPLYSIVGNHDIGFHYAANPYLVHRFDKEFNNTGISLVSIRGVHFVSINSIAMEGDGCFMCEKAEKELNEISKIFKCARGIGRCQNVPKLEEYSKPIVLQHFPMYRESDGECKEFDTTEFELYRERWEVISKESTELILETLEPRLAFSGHSHHYCHLTNSMGIEEYTLASFSWRNKNNPSFVLAEFTTHDFSVRKCKMPEENQVIRYYFIGTVTSVIISLFKLSYLHWLYKKLLLLKHKSNNNYVKMSK